MRPAQFFRVLHARSGLALTIFLLTVASAVGIGMLLPKKYTATAALILDPSRADPMAPSAPGAPSPTFVSTQIDVLKSDRVALGAVRALKLNQDATLHRSWWEATKGEGSEDEWIASTLQKMLEVAPARDSNVINVGVVAADPAFAATLANALVQSYLDVSLELRVDPAKQDTTFLDARAKELHANLERAQERLAAFQTDQAILVSDERLGEEMSRLTDLTAQLTLLQGGTGDAAGRLSPGLAADLERLPEVQKNPTLVAMRAELSHSEERLRETIGRLGEGHPKVLEGKADLADLRARLEAETRRVAGVNPAPGNVAAGALAAPADAPRVAELRGMLEEQRTRVLRMKAVRDESLALEHEVETAQRTYDTVVGRLNQTHLQGQAPQNNAYVLSQATPPRLPSSPKMLLNAAVSVVVGLLLASCAVIGLERIDPRVRTAQEASTLIGVPLLGVLPAPDAPPLFTPRKTPLARPKVTSLLSAPSKEA